MKNIAEILTNERTKNQIKNAILLVLKQYGVSTSIESEREGRKGEYYYIETKDISMSPQVFSKLYCSITLSVCSEEDNVHDVYASIDWKWEQFNGGCNGAFLCGIRFSVYEHGNISLINILPSIGSTWKCFI